jgi:lipase maturation factor 1
MPEPRNFIRFLFDRDDGPTNHLVARWLFLRALGLIYFSAFFALAFQILGLNGSNGILPVAEYLQRLQQFGPLRFWFAPSLLWFWSTDHALLTLVWLGLAASVLATLNILPRPALLVCFLCFLSFVTTAQDFSSYQSDGMLLEAGFLALFLAPTGLRPRWGRNSLACRASIFLLLWEWFRIYFESGIVKLASGDPTWRNLTAMYEYYQNGPLPTWIGWYLQHLPFWFHKLTAGATLFMELAIVWLAFLPRRFRLACFVIVTLWQIGVIDTANYAFLNYLVLALGFLLLDDASVRRFLPTRFRPTLDHAHTLFHENEPNSQLETHNTTEFQTPTWRHGLAPIRIALTAVCLTLIAYVTTLELLDIFWHEDPLPHAPISALEPFRIANQYGLFAVMTPHRYEIEFQGSDDGTNWKPYTFRYKPQDPDERPRIYAPYQPRFDWNLWFASLQPWQQSPIVPLTEERLLENSPQTLNLFRANPFPNHPPKLIRAVLYQYWFSSPEQKRTHGLWWRRQYLGTFAPTLQLRPDGQYGEVAAPELSGPPEP